MDPNSLAGALVAVSPMLKPFAETGCKLLENLLGEPCKAAGQLLADKIYFWQWENRVRMACRAKVILDRKGIAPRVIAPGFLLPLMEATGKVDDPDLQELWANLLVSAIENDDSQHPAFIETLRRMNSQDAKLLMRLASEDKARYSLVDVAPSDRLPAERLHALSLLDYEYINEGGQPSPGDVTGFAWQFISVVTGRTITYETWPAAVSKTKP